MTEIVTNCPLCGGFRSRLFDRRLSHNGLVTNQICETCGLVFQSPRMTEEELSEYYVRDYRQTSQGSDEPARRDLAVQAGRAEILLGFVQGYLKGVTRHLDIGCSAGILLDRFHREFNSQPVGVEPGNAYRSHAQNNGLRVYATLDELQHNDEGRFDLISLAHVLEHIPEPVEYLRVVRENLLEKDGWLLVEVPNLYAHQSFETAHMISFSNHTLVEVLHSTGFVVVARRNHGQPRSKLIPLYIAVLARPQDRKDPASPYRVHAEVGVPVKRRVGMFYRRLLERLFPGLAWLPVP